jgi:uncharacterized membrane protein SpoIIM required for sporulation
VKVLKVILLSLSVSSFLLVVLIPPFYSYHKSAELEKQRTEVFLEQYWRHHFLRRDWVFIFTEAGTSGCRPVDWGMLALEFVGVFGLWFGTWLLFRRMDERRRRIDFTRRKG